MFHPLDCPLPFPPAAFRPTLLNDPLQPFSYSCRAGTDVVSSRRGWAESLVREAIRLTLRHVEEEQLSAEVAEGKMLGVLLCQEPSGTVGFLAAYSGQLGGREDWPWFVPAVFDYLQPYGHFRQEEARISAISHTISQLQQQEQRQALCAEVELLRRQADDDIEAHRRLMAASKQRRDEQRARGTDDEALTRESQFQKAELRRKKKHWAERIQQAEERLRPLDESISRLSDERRQRSERLQQWLFDHFVMLDGQGHKRTLTSIFADTTQRVPPSGAGECCAPKLLQYAFARGLRPILIAEFWQGRSPRMEVRHSGQFYAACRGKCKPILEWMLAACHEEQHGPNAESKPCHEEQHGLRIIYEDGSIVVVDKPSGLLSVPGLTSEPSVESILSRSHGRVYMVHRLDQDTSGLMVVALTLEAYHHMQRQFVEHRVGKHYVALVSGSPPHERCTVSLPLRADPYDRPRQVVDIINGRRAVSVSEVLRREGPVTRLLLKPLTGRTHQLRVHCAHADGLGTPIVGDRLYGLTAEDGTAQRLCLHAAQLTFIHPLTGEKLSFQSEVPF